MQVPVSRLLKNFVFDSDKVNDFAEKLRYEVKLNDSRLMDEGDNTDPGFVVSSLQVAFQTRNRPRDVFEKINLKMYLN